MTHQGVLRLLFVEDVAADRELAEEEFRRNGIPFASACVQTRDEFLNALVRFEPDVVIADYALPRFDGMQALQLTLAHDSLLPFVVFTGSTDEETAVACIKAGAADYVIKQHSARLPLAVERALERALLLRSERDASSAHTASLDELTAIYDYAPLIMFLIDDERHVVRANRYADEYLNRDHGGASGMLVGEALRCAYALEHPEGCGAGPHCVDCTVRATILETLSTGLSHHQVQVSLASDGGDGDGRLVLLLSTSRIGVRGTSYVVVTILDITARMRAEAALKESEETYRALVNGLPDIVMRFDRDGRHLFVSDTVRSVVDLSPADFLGKSHRELGFAEEQCRVWEEAIREVFDSGVARETELSFIGLRGPVVFNWRLLPERDSQGVVRSVLSISRDITGHRKVERDYRTLFNEMLDGFALHEIVCDDDGRPVDYRFLAVNPAFERMTGLKAADVLGRNVRSILPGIEPFWIEAYGRVALSGEPRSFEHYASQLDRHYEVTAFSPAPRQFVAIFADVTERARAQAALRSSEQLLQRVFDLLPIGLWIADKDGRLLRGNPAGVRIWGGEPLVGPERYGVFRARRLPSGEEIAPDDWALMHTVREGRVVTDELLEIDAFDGRKRTILNYTAPVLDESGVVQGAVVVNQDITDRIAAEQALRASEERFRGMFETSQVGVAIVNATTQRFLDANASFLRLLGYSLDELRGLTVADITPEDDWTREQRLIGDYRTGRVSEYRIEKRYVRKDGSMRYVIMVGELLHLEGDTAPVAIANVLDITERRRAEEELRESRQEMRMLASRLEEIRETERTGIARELHDQVGQALTALRMDLERLAASPEGNAAQSQRALLDGMVRLIDQTSDDVRRISSELRPGVLDDFGLVTAMEWQLAHFGERSGIATALEAEIEDALLDRPRTTAVFRVFQELLTNVARHAGASNVRVALRRDEGRLCLEVADDGRGIAPEQAEGRASLGIIGMRERLAPFGGTLAFQPRRPMGTLAVVVVPFLDTTAVPTEK